MVEETISGEAIIQEYLTGSTDGVVAYNRLCRALDLLKQWQPKAAIEFLSQFVSTGHLLDYRCKQLVQQFLRLEWQTVPAEIRPRFVTMLREIGVQHVTHTESVMKCLVDHLHAKMQPVLKSEIDLVGEQIQKFELKVSEEEQNDIFALAHSALSYVLLNFAMSMKCFSKVLRQSFPHYSLPTFRYVGFVKNMLRIPEYAPNLRTDLLHMIIDGLVQIDAVAVYDKKLKVADCDFTIFKMDEDYEVVNEDVNNNDERLEKLDRCISLLLAYIARAHGSEIPSNIVQYVSGLPLLCRKDELFGEMLPAFEEHLLLTHKLRNVPFVWFYICSLDPVYHQVFLKWLWRFVTNFSKSPNEWRKAHGAACYIGSFLSRASYIELSSCLKWMEVLQKWCTTYVNEMVDRSIGSTAGSARHGAFYAVFQALLIAFCFRYREIVQTNGLSIIQRWGFGHIIHSKLQPLTFISRPVALCFATISRSLQLVYCNHILPNSSEEQLPFEPNFPFDSFCLKHASSFITKITRKFSPLADDVNVLKSELHYKTEKEIDLDEKSGSWELRDDFAWEETNENDMDVVGNGGTHSMKSTGDFLTMYSTSPGLQLFKTE